MNICLMMIVKNEEGTISRCLDSASKIISQYVIIDTGSTDGTKSRIEQSLSGISGQIIDRPWVNFGHNRSELVAMMPKDCDYALLLDADMTIAINEEQFNNFPHEDVLMLKVAGSLEYRMPYLVKNGPKYRFVGSTHEYLDAERALVRRSFDGITIYHHADGGSRSDKFERDERLLKNDLAIDPSNSRTHFYLAQTLKDLNKIDESLEHYERAKVLSNWVEERYVAALTSGHLLSNSGRLSESLDQYYQAIEIHPSRAEAYYYAGKVLNSLKYYRLASLVLSVAKNWVISTDILFVERWVEEWGLKLEYGVALWWRGDRTSAKPVFEDLLNQGNLPEHIVEVVKRNITLC
jgi:tetratricopeptide (TPR) repeat protein